MDQRGGLPGDPSGPGRGAVRDPPAGRCGLSLRVRGDRRVRGCGGTTMKLDRIVKGGTVVTPAGTFVGDVGIAGEKIVALGADLEATPGADVVDATGHHVLPGVL